MKKTTVVLAALIVGSAGMEGCKNSRLSRQEQGAIIGAGAGGAAGAVIGNKSGNTAVGAIIGAAVGGTAGALIGLYMDKQAREIDMKVKDAKVERIGEGIKVTFDSGLLFAFDSYAITEETQQNLDELAQVLKDYDETNILVEGHTDNTGERSYNQSLSVKRADAVAEYLRRKNVSRRRVNIQGYGEGQPIADNSTESGQSKNRRVEVVITANEKLKEKAKKEAADRDNTSIR